MARYPSFARALALGIPLLASVQLLLAQEPQRLNVSLTRPNRLIATLPFDEPIRIVGPVPAYVDTVVATHVSLGGRISGDCPAVASSKDPRWIRASGSRDTTVADSFDVLLDPLLPDRNYVLCLLAKGGFPDTTFARIQRDVSASIDRTLHAAANRSDPDLTPEEARTLLAEFRKAAPRFGPNQRLDSASAPLFMGVITDDAVDQLEALKEPVAQRGMGIGNLRASGMRVRQVLFRIGSTRSPALRRLLDTVAPSDTIGGWLVASAPGTLAAIRFLLRTVPDTGAIAREALERVAVALGSPNDSSFVPPDRPFTLDSIWTAEQSAAYLARVQATRQSLEGLRTLAAVVAVSETAQRRTGIDANTALALSRDLDSLSTQLRALNLNARALNDAIMARDRTVRDVVKHLSGSSTGHVPLVTSTVAVDLNTRAKRYISPDLGVAYLPQIGEATPYFGVTFFPLGYNRNVVQRGLRPYHSSFGLMLGLSATSLAKSDERKDLFGNSNVLFGGTMRFFDVFRVSAGGVALRQLNPETQAPDAPVRLTYFTSLSFDFDVKGLFGGIGSILSGGK